MKVFVIGGTGALGRHLVPALSEHEVTLLDRTRTSIYDTEALTRAFAGHDAVINVATRIPPAPKFFVPRFWKENNRIRVEGSRAVSVAAQAAGVSRLVQESIAFNYASSDDWLDEDSPLEPFAMGVSTLVAQDNALAHPGGVVLRYGLFYGPGSAQTAQLLQYARLRVGFVPGPPQTYTSSIHLADAASAAVAALDAPPGVYNVADDEPLTALDYSLAIEAAVGRRAWVRGPGRFVGVLGKAAATGMRRSQRVSNAKLKAATGWSPRYPSAREGYAESL